MNTDSDPTREAVRAALRALGDAAGPAPTFERLTLPTETESVALPDDRRPRRALVTALAAASVLAVALAGWQLLDIGDRDPKVDTQPSVTAPPSADPNVLATSPPPSSTLVPTTPRMADTASGWMRLPDPPLSPRTRPIAVWSGEEVIVMGGGGEDAMCPPNAKCVRPGTSELFTDGAAYNPATDKWRPIADAPLPVWGTGTAVDGDVYVRGACDDTSYCTDVLLRYRPRTDEWTQLDAPPGGFAPELIPTEHMLASISPTDETGDRPDYVLDVRTMTWTELPDDPFDVSYDRQAVWHQGNLYLFATPVGAADDKARDIEGARYDPRSGDWKELAPSGTSGYNAWLVDGQVVINPHSANGGGGVYEPSSDRWSPLPSVPTDDWSGDMVGVLGEDSASYGTTGGGFVLDVPSSQWLWVVDRSGTRTRYSEALTAVGRSLFTFGGERWGLPGAADGELLDEAWMWTPPGIFDGLDMRLELAKTTVASGGTIRSTLQIANNSGSTVTDPGCVIPAGKWGLIPADEPNTELEWSVVIDCGGPFEMPDGFSDQWSGPEFVARTLTGEPLPPGEYLAALEIDGRTERLTVPVTIE